MVEKNTSPTFAEGKLHEVYLGILDAVMEIAEHLRYNTSNKIATSNDFGET